MEMQKIFEALSEIIGKGRVTDPNQLVNTRYTLNDGNGKLYEIEIDWINGHLIGSVFEISMDCWNEVYVSLVYRICFGRMRNSNYIRPVSIQPECASPYAKLRDRYIMLSDMTAQLVHSTTLSSFKKMKESDSNEADIIQHRLTELRKAVQELRKELDAIERLIPSENEKRKGENHV